MRNALLPCKRVGLKIRSSEENRLLQKNPFTVVDVMCVLYFFGQCMYPKIKTVAAQSPEPFVFHKTGENTILGR